MVIQKYKDRIFNESYESMIVKDIQLATGMQFDEASGFLSLCANYFLSQNYAGAQQLNLYS